MAKRRLIISTAALPILLIAVTITVFSSRFTEALESKIAHLEFYMHDTINGPNPTAVRVAPSKPLNLSGSDPISANFGSVYVLDNPLTATPDPKSTLVGRAQGMYLVSSLKDEFSLFMTLTFAFISGPYNCSTFSVVGRNPIMRAARELPVVGGTGAFRLARGYCLLQTHSMSGVDAVVGYNTTLIH